MASQLSSGLLPTAAHRKPPPPHAQHRSDPHISKKRFCIDVSVRAWRPCLEVWRWQHGEMSRSEDTDITPVRDRSALVTPPVTRRRRYGAEEKKAILAEASAPGATISEVSRRHQITRSLIHNWRRLLLRRVHIEAFGAGTRRRRTASLGCVDVARAGSRRLGACRIHGCVRRGVSAEGEMTTQAIRDQLVINSFSVSAPQNPCLAFRDACS